MTRPGWYRPAVMMALAAACLAAAAAPSRAAFVTSPPGDGVAGNGQGVAPFTTVGDTNGNRYQQIYSSGFFAGVGSSQAITAVAFRPKQGAFGTFIGSSLILSDVTVRLSTTRRNADTDFPNGLSGDLALNVGADVRTVFSGPLTLTTSRLLFDTGVGTFDFLIPFQTAFNYVPGSGNLLLEVIIPAGATVRSNGSSFTQLDSFTDGFPSRDGTASATDANLLDGLTVGSNSTTGAVTRFTTVSTPEPASLTVLAGATLGLAAAVRRRRAA